VVSGKAGAKHGDVYMVAKMGDGEYRIVGVGRARTYPEFPNYAVTQCGRVFRVEGPTSRAVIGREKKATPDRGYTATWFTDGKRRALRRTHTVVAETWIGPKPSGYVVNHIDGDRKNSHVDNLEYVTHRQNILHAHGMVDYLNAGGGKEHGTQDRKVAMSDDEICKMRKGGASLQDIERASGVPMQRLMPILKAGGAYPWV